MSLAFDPANWRQAAIERRRRLYNPPNAKHDPGVNIKNGKPVAVELPEPVAIPAHVVERDTSPSNKQQAVDLNDLTTHELRNLTETIAEMIACRSDAKQNITILQPQPRPKVQDIQRIVARFYSVTRLDVLSSRRTANVVWPRQVTMYLCRHLTLRSLPEIGRLTGGRDHTTAMHAIRKVSGLVESDERIRDEIQLLTKRIYERCGIEPPKEGE
jgi:hypothetical protein